VRAAGRRRATPERIAEAKAWRIGQPVAVVRDDWTVTETATRSEPWQLGSGDWVIMVEGISGGYALERVSTRAGK
jgi:hypothetical protein